MSAMLEAPPLSDRQRMIFGFIFEAVLKRGYPPTVREIGRRFHITSPNGVMCHLSALEKKGWIDCAANTSRGTRILRALDGRHIVGFRPIVEGALACPCCDGSGEVSMD